MNPSDFIKLIDNRIHSALKQYEDVKFAKVDPSYTSGRPSLIFDGETMATIKKYPYVSTYTPAANDRVLILKGVIVGKII